MIRLLRFLFTGEWHICQHQWDIHETWTVSQRARGGFDDWRKTGTRYAMRCKHCGEITERTVGDC